MWVNLSNEEVALIRAALSPSLHHKAFRLLDENLDRQVTQAFDPVNLGLRMEAFHLHHVDGEVEVDDQNDNSALVSIGEEGAYVMAWVWVPFSDDDEEDAETDT